MKNKKIIDKHYIKGLFWDILIDVYMPDKNHYSAEETEKRLQEIQVIINKLDYVNIFEFFKVLLAGLAKIANEEKLDFEEVFLPNKIEI